MKTIGNNESSFNIYQKINELPTAAILLDKEDNIIFFNREFCKLTAYQNSELLKTIGVIIEQDEGSELSSISGKDLEICKLRHKSGKLIPVIRKQQNFKIEDNDHKVILFFTMSSFNSQKLRNNYEDETVEARNRTLDNEYELKAIFDNVPSIVILFDENQRVVRINNKGLITFKISESEIVGKNLCETIDCLETKKKLPSGESPDNCCSTCILRKALERTIHQNEEINKKEISLSYLDEGKVTERTILLSTARVKKHGNPLYLATVDDITVRKQMEKELIQAKDKAEESERLKTAFLENMSHEIRTPMNGLLGFANLMENEKLSRDQRKKFIEIINKSGNRLIQTIDKIVEMSKLDSGVSTISIEKFGLRTELDSFINNYGLRQTSENVVFINEFEEAGEEIILETDKTRLFQILKYLLDNAFKYTEKGFVILNVSAGKSFVTFSVKDTGIGIDKEHQKEIFKPFRQGQGLENVAHEGNGLGLTIVKKLLDRLGGTISLESEPGKGSCFNFTIPVSSIIQYKHYDQDDPAYKLKTDRTILIAEKSDDEYNKLKSIISNEVLNTIHAKNIEEAIRITSRNKKIKLVIINSQLILDSGRINEIMQYFTRNIPVIAYGDRTLNGFKGEWEKNEKVEFIKRPLKQDKLLKGIKKHLREN